LYSLAFTGYIDAIMEEPGLFFVLAETRRPIGTWYHSNQFQTNMAPMGAAMSADNAVQDRSSLGVNHLTIPNHPTVQQDLLTSLRAELPDK